MLLHDIQQSYDHWTRALSQQAHKFSQTKGRPSFELPEGYWFRLSVTRDVMVLAARAKWGCLLKLLLDWQTLASLRLAGCNTSKQSRLWSTQISVFHHDTGDFEAAHDNGMTARTSRLNSGRMARIPGAAVTQWQFNG